jgi:hypothetical protein
LTCAGSKKRELTEDPMVHSLRHAETLKLNFSSPERAAEAVFDGKLPATRRSEKFLYSCWPRDNHLNEDVAAMTGGGVPPFKLCEMIAVLPIHYRLPFEERSVCQRLVNDRTIKVWRCSYKLFG